MIVVWGRRNSINVQKVLWTLAELDLPFERHNVGGSFGGTTSAEFTAMNPNGLVPVLRDGDITMFESNAMVRYLAARYGAGILRPHEPQALALAEQWMEWTTTTVAPHAGVVFMQSVRTPSDKRNQAAIAHGAGELNNLLPAVDAVLAVRPFLAGDRLTFADIPLGCFMWRLHQFDWPRPVLANLERWYLDLQSRPAYRKWVMVPVGRNPDEWLANERALA
ncbi:MAG: glutathione S-transferase family protein [Pseudomonadota bacterium]|nr:glutathione S-transferase family protein [Pseudomonadota bacterium]